MISTFVIPGYDGTWEELASLRRATFALPPADNSFLNDFGLFDAAASGNLEAEPRGFQFRRETSIRSSQKF